MIDFRYHIVSLISVFLALAVGIVLGAGPLKETIGDQLTGQVDQLRQDRDDLRSELDRTSGELADAEDYLAGVAPGLLSGTLTGWRVALVTVDDPDADAVTAVAERLAQAGALVTAEARLADGWSDPSRRAYRQALGASMVEYLDPAPPADGGPERDLAEALVQGLTTADPQAPDTLADSGPVLLDLLTQSGLVELSGEVTMAADAVVVLAGDAPHADGTSALGAHLAAQVPVAAAAAARSAGVVVVAVGQEEPALVRSLRADPPTAMSTVDDADRLPGQVSVPLALAAQVSGTAGHYGTDEDATAPAPGRATPEAPGRVPVAAPIEDGQEPDGTDPAGEPGADDADQGADDAVAAAS